MSTHWWFDELAHAGSEHLDETYVAAYDTKSPTLWTDEIAQLPRLGIGAGSTIIDIGAGTGAFAVAARPHVARVVAVDVSPTMVALMRDRGVEAVEGGFLTYEHEGEPADLVLSRNALHHLPDFWKALALTRVGRLLRPGGVFILEDIVYSFDPKDAGRMIESWLQAAPTDPARGWTAEQLAEHVRTEHSTFSWLLEPMFDRAGFAIENRRYSDNGIYAAYTCRLRSD
ncbi:MAG TPA: class I SAM-dependent methyltransferase [Gaiellaceae bacterium]|nr:class I SAM-dependent methyltransferase [Gaiellaceae bacterium]